METQKNQGKKEDIMPVITTTGEPGKDKDAGKSAEEVKSSEDPENTGEDIETQEEI